MLFTHTHSKLLSSAYTASKTQNFTTNNGLLDSSATGCQSKGCTAPRMPRQHWIGLEIHHRWLVGISTLPQRRLKSQCDLLFVQQSAAKALHNFLHFVLLLLMVAKNIPVSFFFFSFFFASSWPALNSCRAETLVATCLESLSTEAVWINDKDVYGFVLRLHSKTLS